MSSFDYITYLSKILSQRQKKARLVAKGGSIAPLGTATVRMQAAERHKRILDFVIADLRGWKSDRRPSANQLAARAHSHFSKEYPRVRGYSKENIRDLLKGLYSE